MYEGLIVRISGFMRKIHLIVIHCSATRADKELTAFDLDTMHRRRGFNGIGYHFYIRKNGDIKTTRPIERIGAHAKGFNQTSIGICYEGGLDCHGRPADTRTEWVICRFLTRMRVSASSGLNIRNVVVQWPKKWVKRKVILAS